MTTTKGHTMNVMGYEVTAGQGDMRWESKWSIAGEYHLHGKRGAHYVTFRAIRNGKPDNYFQFMNFRTMQFVAIHGNRFLSVDNFLAVAA